MKKIVVLGGSGFIGTYLVENLLVGGYEVVIGDLVKSLAYPALWRKCDICNKEQLLGLLSGADTIINLAAEHRDDVRPLSLYEQTNVVGSRLVCEAAAEVGIDRIVFTSSVAVYGFPSSECGEEGPFKPFNEYGRTKLLAENEYNKWLRDDTTRSLFIVRPTVVFGEGNRGNVYNLLKQICCGRFMMIGSGRNKKSMAYVGNVVAFLCWGLDCGPGLHVYNYVDKPDFCMNSLVLNAQKALGRQEASPFKIPFCVGWLGGFTFDLLAKLTGRTFPISRIRIRKFCSQTVFSSKKLQESDFTPPFDLSEGLAVMVKNEFASNG